VRPTRSWSALTPELKNKSSPVRQFLDQRFPHLRDVQRQYSYQVGPIAVPGDPSVSASTQGGAVDWLIRFLVNPKPDLHLALNPGVGAHLVPAGPDGTANAADMAAGARRMAGAIGELAGLLRAPLPTRDATESFTVYAGPLMPTRVDPELLSRGCWALALLTEVYRCGLMPGSPLLTLDHRDLRAEDLLALAPEAALVQLAQLRQVAEDALLPALCQRRGSWAVGPTFDGSEIMNADADLVAAGLLLEIKTVVGRKLKDGSRQAELDGDTIRQILGYLLLDFSDRFEITELGLYSARYGHLATWDVRRLLEDLAGRPVDLTTERAAFRELLLAGPSDRAS
jgi:hypothetical protein